MLSALNGDWKLVYTSNSELLAILALAKLPFVTIGDITQRVDAASSTVENKVRARLVLRMASRRQLPPTHSAAVAAIHAASRPSRVSPQQSE